MEGKRQRAKPQDDSRRTRNSQVKIRLTADEVEQLKAAAAASNMSLADFVMGSIGEPRRIVLPGGGQIWKELVKEGRNFNQAVMLCNYAMKNGQQLDLQSLNEAAASVTKTHAQLMALIEKWDLDVSEQVKEVQTDADCSV